MKKIVLASASPRRKELLTQIGLKFRVCQSKKEEDSIGNSAKQVVKDLSYIKARDVFDRGNQDTIVIGADTVVALDDRIMGKPADEREAYDMLSSLQGRMHQVYTGVTIIWKQEESVHMSSFYEKTDVEVYPMSETQIRDYIATKDPFDKAGGYGIQGMFAAFVKGICGDYNNVVGLPAGRIYQELKSQNLI